MLIIHRNTIDFIPTLREFKNKLSLTPAKFIETKIYNSIEFNIYIKGWHNEQNAIGGVAIIESN